MLNNFFKKECFTNIVKKNDYYKKENQPFI